MSAKEKIRQAAHSLFYNQGIHATGIDSIIKLAGVAKQSFYNHFVSKQCLVLDYLALRHQQWLDLYAIRLQQTMTPQDRILAIYDAYQDHAEKPYENGFRGCGLLNAAAEFPVDSLERRCVAEQKAQIEQFILTALNEIPSISPDAAQQLTQEVAFLLEGCISLAGLRGHPALLQQAKQIIAQRLESL